MPNAGNTDLLALFRKEFGTSLPNFNAVDAAPELYNPLLDWLGEITAPLLIEPPEANLLMGFRAHYGIVPQLALKLGIGHAEAVKIWYNPKEDSPTADFNELALKWLLACKNGKTEDFILIARFDEGTLKAREQKAVQTLNIIGIDDNINLGVAATAMVTAVRKVGFIINHVVLLSENAGSPGRSVLRQHNVFAHSVLTHSETGLDLGILPNDWKTADTDIIATEGNSPTLVSELAHLDRRERFRSSNYSTFFARPERVRIDRAAGIPSRHTL